MALTATQNAIIRKTATGAFYTALDARKPSIDVGRFVSTDSTTAISKDYGWFGMPPFPREWTGPRAVRMLRDYTDTITPKKWELTVGVERETLEDDQTMQLTIPRVSAALAERAQEHVVKRFSEVLEGGTAGSYDTAWDGQFYYDTDHSFGNSGTVNNDLTTTVADSGGDFTAAEFETAFGDAIEAMIAFPNDQGDPAGAIGNMRFTAVVPTELAKVTGLVLNPGGTFGPGSGGENQSTSATGLTAAFRGASFDYVINPYLTNADRFHVLRPGLAGAIGPFVLVNRVPWEVDFEYDWKNDCYTFYGRARYEVGYADFLSACIQVAA